MEFTALLISYLLGSIPFGLLVSKIFGIKDIRQHGSGNIGATNVFRTAGAKAGMIVYLLDIGKAVLAVLIAKKIFAVYGSPIMHLGIELYLIVVVLIAVFGHVFSVFVKFKGGKGASTAFGGILMILPLESVIAFVVFVLTVTISKYVSLGTMLASVSLFTAICVEKFLLGIEIPLANLFFGLSIMLIIIITHHSNIRRLIAGSENRFSLSSSKKVEAGEHV